jgi:hypothetical protein
MYFTNYKFPESVCSENNASLMGVMIFCSHLMHFKSIWLDFHTVNINKIVDSNCEFYETWRSERYVLLTAIDKFLSVRSTFIPHFGRISI